MTNMARVACGLEGLVAYEHTSHRANIKTWPLQVCADLSQTTWAALIQDLWNYFWWHINFKRKPSNNILFQDSFVWWMKGTLIWGNHPSPLVWVLRHVTLRPVDNYKWASSISKLSTIHQTECHYKFLFFEIFCLLSVTKLSITTPTWIVRGDSSKCWTQTPFVWALEVDFCPSGLIDDASCHLHWCESLP
jgi:hypothetical protein